MRVCILGHGLSSLTLAKALVNQNIYVEIISFKKIQKLSPSRTLGISKSNINFFNKNIINIEKLLWKLKKIEIYTDSCRSIENRDALLPRSHIYIRQRRTDRQTDRQTDR